VPVREECRVLILDAVYLYSRLLTTLVVRTRVRVIYWTFGERESFDSWLNTLQGVREPQTVVFDGHRGIIAAVKLLWPEARIQRCLVHVARLIRTRITTRPKTEAGRELYQLTLSLFKVRTRRQKRRWIRSYYKWEGKYQPFLAERSYGYKSNGKKIWWYTHKNLRAARSGIRNSLPNLFTYIGHPEIPRTTNHLEGGVNARLKELLHRHRGLSPAHKITLTSYFLKSKQN
jgi:transposase-like protein